MMSSLLTIELCDLLFTAYHGLYAQEKKIGNQFKVQLLVSYEPASGIVTGIDDTINYVSIYELVKQEMDKPVHLLETLCMTIAALVKEKYPQTKKIDISISKLNPPIASFVGNVGVRFSKEY
jgi:7,8-dihydroneopterin aldolase/epimerase/oxygenase